MEINEYPSPTLLSYNGSPHWCCLIKEGISWQNGSNVGPVVGLAKPRLCEGLTEWSAVTVVGPSSHCGPERTRGQLSLDSAVWSLESSLELLSQLLGKSQQTNKSANAFWHLIPILGFETMDGLLLPNLVTHSIKVPVINVVLIFIKWI